MAELLKDMIEVKKVDGAVINGVDNANILSVDSTTPIQTDADELEDLEEAGKPKEEKKVDDKIEKKPLEASEKKPEEKKVEEEEHHTKDAIQERINKAVKKQRTAERERDWERAKRQELEQELSTLKNQIPPTDKPKKEDYVSDEDYLEALTDWKVEQKTKSTVEVTAKTTEEEEDRQAAAALYEVVDTVVEKGRDKYKDFDTVAMAKDVMITLDMFEVIVESPVAEDIVYHLGSNPDIAADIAKMSPLKAAKKIAEIEAELVKKVVPPNESREEIKEVQPKLKIPKAPEPITPVRANSGGEVDPSTMSPKEYRAWREKNK